MNQKQLYQQNNLKLSVFTLCFINLMCLLSQFIYAPSIRAQNTANHRIYMLWSQALFLKQQNAPKQALKRIDEALIYKKSAPKLWMLKIQLEAELGLRLKALKSIDRLLLHHSKLLKSQKIQHLPPNKKYRQSKKQRSDLKKKLTYEQMLQRIKILESQKDTNLERTLEKNQLLLETGQWQKAHAELSILVKLYPQASIYNYAAYQNVLFPNLSHQQAMSWSEQALFQNPLNAAYLDTYAILLAQNNELYKAKKYLEYADTIAIFDFEIKAHLKDIQQQITAQKQLQESDNVRH